MKRPTCKWCIRHSGHYIGLCTINGTKGKVHLYNRGYRNQYGEMQSGLWTVCGFKLQGQS